MTEDIRERMLQAAELADRHADAITAIRRRTGPHAGAPTAPVPMELHWEAVATLLRAMVVLLHQTETHTEYNIPVFDEFDSSTSTYRRCAECHHRYYPVDGRREQDGCPSLRLLLPLVGLAIADLGIEVRGGG